MGCSYELGSKEDNSQAHVRRNVVPEARNCDEIGFGNWGVDGVGGAGVVTTIEAGNGRRDADRDSLPEFRYGEAVAKSTTVRVQKFAV
jgi:hypothetical protein